MINRYIIQVQAIKSKAMKTSVADPDPSMIKKNSKENLNSYCFVLLYDFLSLKNDVNVACK
jgi:hypothetical protein